MSNTQTPATLYDWSTAPDWANWAAMDRSNRAYWYEKMPKINPIWFTQQSYSKIMLIAADCDLPCAWQDSLEQRPTDKDREDAAIIELVLPS